MINKSRYLFLLPLIASGPVLQADWQLVEDFSGTLDNWYFSDPNQNCESVEPDFCDGVRTIVDDPVDGGNPVGSFKAAADNVTANWTAVNAIDLPESITDGRVFTVYAKFAIKDFRMDTTFGLMSLPAGQVTNSFDDYETIIRMNYQYGGLLQCRDFDQYVFFSQDPMQNNQWYEVWMVCDNANLTYDVYLKGPPDSEFPQQTLAYEGALNRAGTGNVHSFAVLQSTGSSANPYGNNDLYLDNIFLDPTGENLEAPSDGGGGQTPWGGYPVSPDGNVQTGSFLGSLYVGSEPYSGFVWNYSQGNWMYVKSEWVTDAGTWIYLYK